MPLETERLLLRPYAPGDADLVLDVWSDPPVAEALFAGRERPSRARAEAWVARSVADPPRLFVVERREDGRGLGYAGIQPLPETGEPELLYGLRGEAWGRGYATEAGAAVLRHAWTTLRLPRVVAVVLPENVRSRRVLEKLGFRPLGRTMHHGLVHEKLERIKPDG